jgi:hypothetical protein
MECTSAPGSGCPAETIGLALRRVEAPAIVGFTRLPESLSTVMIDRWRN